jgi:hypothetical protein
MLSGMTASRVIKYWYWFLRGSGGKPGYRRIINLWILVHAVVGGVLALLIKLSLSDSANTVLLPLAGILIGLTFAWAGNAQSLIRSGEIGLLSDYHEGGFTEYVYLYQTAILVILCTLILWGLAGLRIFDQTWPTAERKELYLATKMTLFALSSITIRVCWQVVMGVQMMLIAQKKIKDRMS